MNLNINKMRNDGWKHRENLRKMHLSSLSFLSSSPSFNFVNIFYLSSLLAKPRAPKSLLQLVSVVRTMAKGTRSYFQIVDFVIHIQNQQERQ